MCIRDRSILEVNRKTLDGSKYEKGGSFSCGYIALKHGLELDGLADVAGAIYMGFGNAEFEMDGVAIPGDGYRTPSVLAATNFIAGEAAGGGVPAFVVALNAYLGFTEKKESISYLQRAYKTSRKGLSTIR